MKVLFTPLVFGIFLANSLAFAQDDPDSFIADMLVLADRFAKPASEGAAYQAGAGWFTSAAPLSKWDFRFSLHGNTLLVPENKKSFRLANNDLKLLTIEGAENAELSTAFGGTTNVFFKGDVRFRDPVTGDPQSRSVRFKGFDGIQRDFIPHGFAQFAVGLPYGTELIFRMMPEVTIDKITAGTLGAGLKHNLNQYFRRGDLAGIELAAGIAYSTFHVEYGFAPIEVEDLVMMNLIRVDAHLWVLEVIGSRQWGALELFCAAGGASSNFHYQMGGGGPGLVTVNEKLELLSDTQVFFKGDVGINLHLGRWRLSATGTMGKFLNAHVGLNVRI